MCLHLAYRFQTNSWWFASNMYGTVVDCCFKEIHKNAWSRWFLLSADAGLHCWDNVCLPKLVPYACASCFSRKNNQNWSHCRNHTQNWYSTVLSEKDTQSCGDCRSQTQNWGSHMPNFGFRHLHSWEYSPKIWAAHPHHSKVGVTTPGPGFCTEKYCQPLHPF